MRVLCTIVFPLCCALSATKVAMAATKVELSHAARSDVYVFVDQYYLNWLSAVRAVHTELSLCQVKQFSTKSQAYLTNAIAKKLEGDHSVTLNSSWWTALDEDVYCENIFFGGIAPMGGIPHWAFEVGSGQFTYKKPFNSNYSSMSGANRETNVKHFYGVTEYVTIRDIKAKLNSCNDQWRALDYTLHRHNCNAHTATALKCVLGMDMDRLPWSLTGAANLDSVVGDDACECKSSRSSAAEDWLYMEKLIHKGQLLQDRYIRKDGKRVYPLYVPLAKYEPCEGEIHTAYKTRINITTSKCLSGDEKYSEPRSCRNDGDAVYCPHDDLHARCCCSEDAVDTEKKHFGMFGTRKFCGPNPVAPVVRRDDAQVVQRNRAGTQSGDGRVVWAAERKRAGTHLGSAAVTGLLFSISAFS